MFVQLDNNYYICINTLINMNMIDLSKIPITCGVYCFKNKINNKIYEASIYDVLCKRRKQNKGFVFKYYDDIV